jgi:hypothetical protein
MHKRFSILFLALLFCSMICTIPVRAQEDKPIWWQNLDCKQENQRFSGIEYCTGKPPVTNIYVVIIQLDSPGIKVEYLIPDGIDGNGIEGECKDVNRSTKRLGGPGCDDLKNRNWYPVMSLQDAVKKAADPTLAFVINGDYSACTSSQQGCGKDYREHGPEGLTVVGGERLDGPKNGDGDNNIVRRPWMSINESSPLRAEFHQNRSDNGALPYDWIHTGIGGAPWLIQNGTPSTGAINSCEGAPGSCYPGASQTAVGLSLDKKWMFFVLAVEPKTLLDVATFMDEKLDVWQAIKFDGGGSSQLYYAGAENPYIETGDARPLTNYLAVYAQSGSGIFPEESSEEPPTTEPVPGSELSWWEQIQKSWNDFRSSWEDTRNSWSERWEKFSKDWEEFQKDPTKWFDDWLKREQEKLINGWIQQLVESLNQLCGSAALLPMTLAAVWIARHRKHNRL